jgi:hypothetical protein
MNVVRDALAAIAAEVNETPIRPRRVLAAVRAAQRNAPRISKPDRNGVRS